MTDNDDLRERAKVEQIDRDAAAAAWVRWHDMDTLAAAFARHRASGIAQLQERVERLEAELARRDANEKRNCINWGPCSRMDAALGDGE